MKDKSRQEPPRELKITDRRMFTPEGELREEFKELASAPPPDLTARPAPPPAPEPPPPPKQERKGLFGRRREAPAENRESREPIGSGRPGSPLEPVQGPDFMSVLAPFSTSAYISLGLIPNPATRLAEINLEAAREMIEILGLIAEKTRGNLTAEEAQTLDQLLYELRMIYVEKTRKP